MKTRTDDISNMNLNETYEWMKICHFRIDEIKADIEPYMCPNGSVIENMEDFVNKKIKELDSYTALYTKLEKSVDEKVMSINNLKNE
jgi:hypothetical protein